MTEHPIFGQPRPAWFWGSADKLAVLKEAAAKAKVTLHQDIEPSVDDAQGLEEALASILLRRGFEADWSINAFGSLVEELIGYLHQYAYPDEH
ncbi:hypothetical protein OHV05_34800 [Kitasatospora sp. NBC_00070]|uniref:hypothetical protein n=1 Tax=Kitasatospora sp. NBC_00070 TaxID=2975962 RepID=UPI00324DA522